MIGTTIHEFHPSWVSCHNCGKLSTELEVPTEVHPFICKSDPHNAHRASPGDSGHRVQRAWTHLSSASITSHRHIPASVDGANASHHQESTFAYASKPLEVHRGQAGVRPAEEGDLRSVGAAKVPVDNITHESVSLKKGSNIVRTRTKYTRTPPVRQPTTPPCRGTRGRLGCLRRRT